MIVEMAYFKDVKKDVVARKLISVKNLAFKSSNRAYWKVLIADEDIIVEKNKIAIIKVRKINLPPKSTVAPLSIMRHAFGTVIDVITDVPKKIEETKEITHAYFFSIKDGIVEKGDLIGVIKVYPINVGEIDKEEFIESPDTAPKLEEIEVNLVYHSNREVKRVKTKIKETWYSRWHLGEWKMVVSDEDIHLPEGEARLIKIRDIELAPNSIPVPLYGLRNPFGVVLDIYHPGRPKRIEEKRILTHALFMPIEDCEIRKGDLIGVMNVYAVSVGEMMPRIVGYLTEKSRGNVVLKSNGEVLRKEFEHKPFLFKRSVIGYLKPVIAAETKTIYANTPVKIKIEKIDLPAGSIIQPMSGRNHAYGIIIDVGLEKQKYVEEDRVVEEAVVISPIDGEIVKRDIIGVLMQYQITPLIYPEFFVRIYG